MGTITSPSVIDQSPLPDVPADVLRADEKMALLARAFELQLAEFRDDHAAPWPMGQTLWFSVAVSGALWAIVIVAIRLI